MGKNEFESIKEKIINLSKDKKEITSKTKYKTGGIYMLYIDKFEDDKIIPFYIGKTHDFQDRHKEHMKEIFAINRLSKEYYEYAIINDYFEGAYKSCKIFKYLIDNECTLKDIHMVILEEIEEETKRTEREVLYINKYCAPFFGFNQLNSITLSMENKINKEYFENIKTDILNIEKYINYGFNKVNYLLAKKIFEGNEPKLLKELRTINEIKEIDKIVEKGKAIVDERVNLKKYVNKTSKEKCKLLCGKFIDTFFEKNNLKSEEKKKQIIEGLIYNEEKNKADVIRYIQRFSTDNKEDIFKIILEKENGKDILKIAEKVEQSKKEIEEYGYDVYDLKKEIFKDILPKKDFSSFQLKDTYEEKDIFEEIEENKDNILYINIEYSNHGRRWEQDDYPFVVKVDYALFKDNEKIRKSYFINSSSSEFFKENYFYVIERSLYDFHNIDTFKIGKRGGKIADYSTISTTMEYDNGINEFTLKDKETYHFIDVVKEIDNLIDDKSKIIYTSNCKSIIKRWENSSLEDESLLIRKLIKSIKY